MIQDNLRKEARETCPAARAQAECSSKHETDMAEGGAQVVHSLRHRYNRSERQCTLCQSTATEQKALASNAWDKKKSALAARIARLQVFAAADFAHHVGSNTLRPDLSCSRGTGTRGMTLSHCIGCQRGRTKCAAHLSQMRLDSVDEPVQRGPGGEWTVRNRQPHPARQRSPMLHQADNIRDLFRINPLQLAGAAA